MPDKKKSHKRRSYFF